ncbi:phosphosulfolactate synthase, putative [Entamoeba invadens IP1]|uniref:Phosphosulfolactate synthase, putative n=2 Tax=Entamoeba invadens TaxID=33085 RepID=A0A0A1U2C3_ENTIV|nr:phosphosulfolactate synthase, putative [Entamoeba invadens IP1]ELP88179.1 phosphosulfolactate synthase, putative [Entamoeba invadens IP1]BAN40296.1 phosphosulfolactate synthase, putative [Entamoeba invadens]|eukprot:XP_004254950.1 phosphosulfolactate synthase, putative [Entamoeba invadens IP1]
MTDATEMMKMIDFLPPRTHKPRDHGFTMVMDKGLGPHETEDLCITAAPYIDFLKLGFGTSVFTGGLREKLAIYKKYGVEMYVGGTFLEAFIARNKMPEFHKIMKEFGIKMVEVSDGSYEMGAEKKIEIIKECTQHGYYVLSEVGNKCKDREYTKEEWTDSMKAELAAGSKVVIIEARESGTTGIYNKDGSVNKDMVDYLCKAVDPKKVMWEAPMKSQQAWLIDTFGINVNLGNIAPTDAIALEALRNGLRGDTFAQILAGKF